MDDFSISTGRFQERLSRGLPQSALHLANKLRVVVLTPIQAMVLKGAMRLRLPLRPRRGTHRVDPVRWRVRVVNYAKDRGAQHKEEGGARRDE